MSVYVDELRNWGRSATWRWDRSCHMWADSEEELVAFAKSIGLKSQWIQRGSLVHFDLTASKRRQAVAKGAIGASDREMVTAMKGRRDE